MVFIKRLITLISVLLLFACASQPANNEGSQEAPSTQEPVVEGAADADAEEAQAEVESEEKSKTETIPVPEVKVVPNPYLKNPPNIPDAARREFEFALQLLSEQRWAQAEQQLQYLQQSFPKFSGSYVNMGIVYRNTNRADQAIAQFQQAVKVNANNFDAYNLWAITLREQGKFDEARKVYERSLDRWPSQPTVHRNLGILYDLYLGDLAKALKHYQLAQALLQEPDKLLGVWIKDLSNRVSQ